MAIKSPYEMSPEERKMAWEDLMAKPVITPAYDPLANSYTQKRISDEYTQRIARAAGMADFDKEHRNYRLLAMRLRLGEGMRFPFPHISIYCDSKKAYVFIVDKLGSAVTLEDDPDLFPSDTLVGKLRLMLPT